MLKRFGLFAIGLLLAVGCGAPEGTVGGTMPNLQFEAYANAGKFVSMGALRGKVVLVDFWATWCGPCRESMPHIAELNKRFQSKGFQVLGVTDEDRAKVTSFFGGVTPPYPIYFDNKGSANAVLKVDSLPTAIVLDRKGKIVYRGHPEDPETLKAIEAAVAS